jgi:EsV-1-7 cysteine-rich motif
MVAFTLLKTAGNALSSFTPAPALTSEIAAAHVISLRSPTFAMRAAAVPDPDASEPVCIVSCNVFANFFWTASSNAYLPLSVACFLQVIITADKLMRRNGRGSKTNQFMCQDPTCDKRASFGYKADRKQLYCAAHKADDMVGLTGIHCKHPACYVQASFGYEADMVRLCCAEHKREGMTNLNNPRCEDASCKIRATFGRPNTKVSSKFVNIQRCFSCKMLGSHIL